MALRKTLVLIIALALAACGTPSPQADAPTPEATAAPASPTVLLPTGTATPPPPTPAPTEPPATPAPTQPPAATAAPSEPTPLTTPTPPLFLEPTAAPGSAPAPSHAPTEAASTPVAEGESASTSAAATAPPAAASDTSARRSATTGQPVRLVIGGIDLDRKLVPVGLDANRLPVVPDHDIGWYTSSAQPGQGENVVLWGHVLRFRKTPDIPAPFARLKELKPGDAVELYDAQGASYRYVVTQQVWATPDQVEYMLPRGREQITMISCIGDKVIEDGSVEMTHRLITIAAPVEGEG